MSKQMLRKIARTVIFVIGGLLLLNAVAITVVANSNLGILATYIAGAFFVLWGAFYRFSVERLHIIIKCIVAVGLASVVGVVSFVYIYGKTDSVTHSEDAIIVLGAGIKGEEISRTLKNRLDVAIDYYRENPEAVIVVTGGQGHDEVIPESLAMQRYLISQGIPESSILKEDKSTSTDENFRFAKQILDEYFKREYSVLFVSDDFHIYRANISAENEGFENIGHLHSTAPFYTLIPNGLREYLAVMYEWVIK